MTAIGSAATFAFFAAFAALSAVLAVIDLRTHRLPDRLVLPAYPVGIVLLVIVAASSGAWGDLWRAIAGGAILFLFYLALRALQPAGMGGGDVKLAGVVGIVLGFVGWDALLIGAFAGFLVGGLFSLIVLVARRAGPGTAIPFGPWMLLGSWIAIALHPWA